MRMVYVCRSSRGKINSIVDTVYNFGIKLLIIILFGIGPILRTDPVVRQVSMERVYKKIPTSLCSYTHCLLYIKIFFTNILTERVVHSVKNFK